MNRNQKINNLPADPLEADGELELSILMPCLNEAETIAICIRKALNFLGESGIRGEIIIGDNGSTDGSRSIAKQLGARVVEVPVRGYGAALLGGIDAARGHFIIMGDADDSYDFEHLAPFVSALRRGADLVMGNRFKGGIAPGAMPILHRYLGNPVLSFIGRLFFRAPVGDFHCGLRAFRADAIRGLELRTTGMEFASEMIVQASLKGLSITEVPTTLKKDGRSRLPHLKTWRDGWRHLKFLLLHSPRYTFVFPGIFLSGLGFVSGSILFRSEIPFHNIVLGFNTFIASCFCCILGVQLITFGVIVRQYAAECGFLPWSNSTKQINQYLTTDNMALFALIIILAGILIVGYPVWFWYRVSFGPINDPVIARVVAVGLTLVVVGMQILACAFLVGVLRIPRR